MILIVILVYKYSGSEIRTIIQADGKNIKKIYRSKNGQKKH